MTAVCLEIIARLDGARNGAFAGVDDDFVFDVPK